MKVNINDMVKVKLTEYGKEISRVLSPDIDGFNAFHLWELMQIFGRCMYLGNNMMPFENNEIYFEEEDMNQSKEEVDTLTVSELQCALALLIEEGHGDAKILFNQRELKHAELIIKHITEPAIKETFLVLTDD
jgi:hypothetical protein